MEYIYSALLLHTAGKNITDENIKKVLDAAGIKPDPARIKALTASLEGVDIEEAVSTAVAAPVAASVGTAPAGDAGAAKPADTTGEKEGKEEKKEKKKEEKKVSEEEAAAGLGALFG